MSMRHSSRFPGPDTRVSRSAFTLAEILVSTALLLLIMGLATQVFKITLDGSGQLQQRTEVDRVARMIENQLREDLAAIDPSLGVLVIQGNPAPAYWTEREKNLDLNDNDPTNGIDDLSASTNPAFIPSPTRSNPTSDYDSIDSVAPLGAAVFDTTIVDDDHPVLPRADVLTFVRTGQPEDRSYRFPDVTFGINAVMLTYGHAEKGTLNPDTLNVDLRLVPLQTPGMVGAGYNNDSTDDWLPCIGCTPGVDYPLRKIPILQNGGGPDATPGVQDVARDWHLARRAVILMDNVSFDQEELNNRDRYAHVLSPTNPLGNQVAGFVETAPPSIDPLLEQHYLNWILGGEIDVVSPAVGPISSLVYVPPFQDFQFGAEVGARVFEAVNNGAFTYGAAPAFWLARSHLDTQPPPTGAHRLGHYFVPHCASFKVEWTPNEISGGGGDLLAEAGLPEVIWIDPFKEPDSVNPVAIANNHPFDPITGVGTKPFHLDEFEIMAQKMSRPLGSEAGNALVANTQLGPPSTFPGGSYLYQVNLGLRARFGNSLGTIAGNQLNVYDFDQDLSSAPQVNPSYNTHSWYSQDFNVGTTTTSVGTPDPLWPKALRITIDLFDDAGRFNEPVRYVFIFKVGQS